MTMMSVLAACTYIMTVCMYIAIHAEYAVFAKYSHHAKVCNMRNVPIHLSSECRMSSA